VHTGVLLARKIGAGQAREERAWPGLEQVASLCGWLAPTSALQGVVRTRALVAEEFATR